MGKYWRYLKVLLTFRDVAKIYKEDTGESTPGWMSRRFWGGVVLMATLVLKNFGTEIDAIQADQWVDTLYNAATGLMSAYGVIMVVVGGLRRRAIVLPPAIPPPDPPAPAPTPKPSTTTEPIPGGHNVSETLPKAADTVVDNDDAVPCADPDVMRRNDPGTTEQANPR